MSTFYQSAGNQESELKAFAQFRNWNAYRIYRDRGQSGAKLQRPGLNDLIADSCKHKIALVRARKFDRFARSLRQLVNAVDDCNQLGIDLVSTTEQSDTTIPSGTCLFKVIGAIAEFERTLIGEHVKSGLSHGRSQGRRLGKPPVRELTRAEFKKLKIGRAEKNISLRGSTQRLHVNRWHVNKLCSDGA